MFCPSVHPNKPLHVLTGQLHCSHRPLISSWPPMKKSNQQEIKRCILHMYVRTQLLGSDLHSISIVLVTVPLLWSSTTTMAALTKESISLWAGLRFQRLGPLSSWWGAQKQAWWVWWRRSWELHLDPHAERTTTLGLVWALETSKATLNDTHILCHISDSQFWSCRRLTCIFKSHTLGELFQRTWYHQTWVFKTL